METRVLAHSASRTETADYVVEVDTSGVKTVTIDCNVTAETGGFSVDVARLTKAEDGDGVVYPLNGTGAIVAAGASVSITVDPAAVAGVAPVLGINQSPGKRLRVTFDVTTTATFSFVITGTPI